MIIKIILICLMVQLCILSSTVHCQSNTHSRTNEIIDSLIKQNSIPGLSLTVIVNNETKQSQGFGFADVERNVLMTPDTLIRIGSISKSMTSVAIAKAMENGDIKIDGKVRDFLPNFTKKHPITLRQLGGHLGGIRSYLNEKEEIVTKHYETVSDSLTIFSKDPLVSIPQTEFHYSSYGFSLLSAAVEVATHKTFVEFMNDYLWVPLHMKHSKMDDAIQWMPGRSRYYIRGKDGKIIHAEYVNNSYKLAGAGMLSTTNDMAHFAQKLLSNSFLKKPAKALLFTSQKTLDDKFTGYGFGWFVDMNKFLDDRRSLIPKLLFRHLKSLFNERKLFWHSGTSSGATAILLMAPETGVVIAITANLGGIGPQIIAAAMELESVFSRPELSGSP